MLPSAAAPRPAAFVPGRAWLRAEVVVVLALSLGRSAVYSLLALVQALAAGTLAEQTTSLNTSLREDPWADLGYQLLSIAVTLTPVALVLLLLTLTAGTLAGALRDLGLDLSRPLRDLGWGIALAAGIGLPGLAVYAIGRAVGATLEVVPAALATHWWTVPVLVLHAVKNAVLEEVIAVGWLSERLERLGWSPARIVLASAVLRGAYHTYQGLGPGLANLAMGVVFALWFRHTRRTMPLVIAHALIDVVAFVGNAALGDALGL